MINDNPLGNDLLDNPLTSAADPKDMLFTHVEIAEKGDEQRLGARILEQATYEDVQNLWSESQQLRETFGSFDNYIDYLTQREEVIQNSDYFDRRQAFDDMQAELASMGSDVGAMAQYMVEIAGLPEAESQKYAEYMALQSRAMDFTNTDAKLSMEEAERMGELRDYFQENPITNNIPERANADTIPELADLNESFGLPEVGAVKQTSDSGDQMTWTGTGWVKTTKVDDHSIGMYAKPLFGLALGVMTGGALGPAFQGALGKVLGGAATGALSSAGSQLIVSGNINPEDLLKSAITGGFSGLSQAMMAGDLAGTALDNAVWDLSGAVGLSYEETLGILTGISNGTLSGGDLEDLAAGAVKGYTSAQIKAGLADYMKDTFGDSVEVDNWFDKGTDTISVDAINAAIGEVVDAGVYGDLSDPMDILKTLGSAGRAYFNNDGSLSFMDPVKGIDITLPQGSFNPGIIDAIKEAGYWIDDNVLQPTKDAVVDVVEPVYDVIHEGGHVFDDAVIQPVKDTIADAVEPVVDTLDDALHYVDDTIIQPTGEFVEEYVTQPVDDALHWIDDEVLQPIRENLPHGETPQVAGPDGELPDVDLDLDVKLPEGRKGGDFAPSWSELFPYTQITPYQKRQLGPIKNFIAQGRGMLS